MTESASITKMPPTSSSSSSTFRKIAIVAIAPPSAIAPVSPMKTSAGKALNQRKPMRGADHGGADDREVEAVLDALPVARARGCRS